MSSSQDWDGPFDGKPTPSDDSHNVQTSSQYAGGRPRLRLGDAQLIAEQRLALAEARNRTSPPELPEANDLMAAGDDVASRLIAALNGGEADSEMASQQYRPTPTPTPTPSQSPTMTGGVAGVQDQRAPIDFRNTPVPSPSHVPPIPVPGQHASAAAAQAPMPGAMPQGATQSFNSGIRAPVAPMRRAAAPQHGLRLRGAPSQGLVAPPISRAQSLYEVLNRSQHSPRPMRRPEPQAHQRPANFTPPPTYRPTPASAAGPETYSNAGGSDTPIAQEVQDAINVILQSLPKGAQDARPEEDERAEALRRVRTLRAQLVGLQNKISLATTDQDVGAQLGYDSGAHHAPQPNTAHTAYDGNVPQHQPLAAPAPQPPATGYTSSTPAQNHMVTGGMPEHSASALDYPHVSPQQSVGQLPPTQYEQPQPAAARESASYGYEPQDHGAYQSDHLQEQHSHQSQPPHQLPANVDEWQDESWDDTGIADEADMSGGIYDDELPKGIVPNANDNSHGGVGFGRTAGVIGGVALAASIAAVAVFMTGTEVPFVSDLIRQAKLTSERTADTDTASNTVTTLKIESAQSGAAVVAALTPSNSSNEGGLALVARDVVGPANKPIRLALTVGDPTGETATVIRIKGVPPGASLSGGFNVGGGTWLVPHDRLGNLQMDVPGYFSGKFELQAQALANDAVTAVSDVTNFNVKIGENRPVAAEATPETGGNEGDLTASTVNQTVPTAGPESVEPPTQSGEAQRIAALAGAQKSLADDSMLKLIQQGDLLLDRKDVEGARKYYKQAADLGSADAALSLGQTYDPAYFATQKMDSSKADTKQALIWYQEALSRGNNTARSMVDRLLKWVQKGSL